MHRSLNTMFVREELSKMGVACDELTVLQDKDGAIVARAVSGGSSYVMKCFRNAGFKREIENYRLLFSLGIPTIQVFAATDAAILTEDIACSPVYRLGSKQDLDDPEVARHLAVWYKQLHQRDCDYVEKHGTGLYDEADFFTLENIAQIKEKTGTQLQRLLLYEHDRSAGSRICHDV